MNKEHYENFTKIQLIDLIIALRQSAGYVAEDIKQLKQLAYCDENTTYKFLYQQKCEENLNMLKKNIQKEYNLEQVNNHLKEQISKSVDLILNGNYLISEVLENKLLEILESDKDD